MARQQKTDTVITDDLTGDVLKTDDAETVTFAVDGTTYEIDLSTKNATSLRNDFAAWTEHARKATRPTNTRPTTAGLGSRRANTTTQRPSTDRQQSALIREWAQKGLSR